MTRISASFSAALDRKNDLSAEDRALYEQAATIEDAARNWDNEISQFHTHRQVETLSRIMNRQQH